MIQGLLDEKSVELYISCAIDGSQTVETQKTPRSSAPVECFLEITVYGPLELFDEIGTWFEQSEVYLQDPRHCHLEVKSTIPIGFRRMILSLARLFLKSLRKAPELFSSKVYPNSMTY